MPYRVEVTDTFGGESNYSWVHRHVLTLPGDPTTKQIVRAAKKAEGWTGMKCDTTDMGDTIEVRPRGMCVVMFIDWQEDMNWQKLGLP